MRLSFPVDPECPVVEEFHSALWGDPMTAWSGVGSEIAERWDAKHFRECKRCQEYGTANVEVI